MTDAERLAKARRALIQIRKMCEREDRRHEIAAEALKIIGGQTERRRVSTDLRIAIRGRLDLSVVDVATMFGISQDTVRKIRDESR
jgi:hypothetical protein